MSKSRHLQRRTRAARAGQPKLHFFRRSALPVAFAAAALLSFVPGNVGIRQTNGAPSPTQNGPSSKVLNSAPASAPNVDWSPEASVGQLQNRNDPSLSKALRKYDLIKLNRRAAVAQVRVNGKLLLKTSEGEFDLTLTPHDLRSKDYRAQVIGADGVTRNLPPGPVNTYKGRVKGADRTQARMTVTDDAIEGSIITGTDRYFIQPARSLSQTAREDELVFYSQADVIGDAAGKCGVTLAEEVAAEAQRAYDFTALESSDSASVVEPLSPPKLVRLATEADAEYVMALGSATQANNQILSIMNQVDGVYQVEIGLTFQIVFQNTWTNAATDPYLSPPSENLLREFADYWNANFAGIQRNLSHLWTGKQSDSLFGMAHLGVVCRDSARSYGFSRHVTSNPANPVTASAIALTAHEIGHNFHGVHTDNPTTEIPADIGALCRATIMQSGLGSSVTFCPFSRSQISGYVRAWSNCLTDSSSPPPTNPPCVETPLDSSLSASGSLASTDCRSPSRGLLYVADRYSFAGQAGQRLSITMSPGTAGLDPFLFLIAPDGYVAALETHIGNPVRLPFSGSFTLPQTGKYIIEATSLETGQFGSYTINVSLDGCVLSVSPTSQHFPAAGGGGSLNVTATGSGCGSSYQFTKFPNTASWLTVTANSGTGSQALNFNVQANSNAPGRRAFLVVGGAFGQQTGGLIIPITQSGTGPDCSLTPIGFGQTITGALSSADCQSPFRGNFFFADRYVFTASAGQEVAISISSSMDSFLALIGPDQRIILTDDDGGGLGNARIPGGTGMLTLGLAGTYVVEVTSFPSGFSPPYSITLTTNTPQPPPVLLSEENSDAAIALTSVATLRDPFSLTDPFNFSSDSQARVMLFATNLDLFPGENSSAVTATAEDQQGNVYPVTVEFAGKVPSFDWLSQIVVKLPSNLPTGQGVRLSVVLHGQTSNKVRLRIK